MHMHMYMHMHMVARLLLSDTLKLQVMPVKFYAELIPSNCLVGDSQPWAGDEHEAETLLLGPKSTITHPAMAEFYSEQKKKNPDKETDKETDNAGEGAGKEEKVVKKKRKPEETPEEKKKSGKKPKKKQRKNKGDTSDSDDDEIHQFLKGILDDPRVERIHLDGSINSSEVDK